MSKKVAYPAVFYPCSRGYGYTVTVPDLPGCTTEGDDMPDSIAMAVDAASGWILDDLENGKTAPEPSALADIKPDKEIGDGFVQYIVVDIAAYSRKYGKQTVRKNLTIPAWLDSAACERQVNFSKVLQDALIEKLHII